MSSLPSLEQFTQVTAKLAAEDGFAGFLPTLVVDGEIRVIEEIPDDLEHRDALVQIHAGMAGREWLFAVLSAPHEITTGHVGGGDDRFMLIRVTASGLQVGDQSAPAWWPRAN